MASPLGPPGILHVIHPDPVRSALVHHNQVESILVAGPPVPIHPDHGHLGLGATLPESQGLRWRTEPVGAARLDLDERHQVAPADDQIQIVVAQPEPTVENAPATRLEKGDGGLLPLVAEDVAGVGPFADGLGSVFGGHRA